MTEEVPVAGHPLRTRLVGRSLAVGGFVVALAASGRPVWLAVLLCLLLLLVWVAPFALDTHGARPASGRVPVIRPREVGPSR